MNKMKAKNTFNLKMRDDNTSGHIGVSWHKAKKKWQAKIQHAGNQIYLGMFHTLEEAAQAYREAALKYHYEFAMVA